MRSAHVTRVLTLISYLLSTHGLRDSASCARRSHVWNWPYGIQSRFESWLSHILPISTSCLPVLTVLRTYIYYWPTVKVVVVCPHYSLSSSLLYDSEKHLFFSWKSKSFPTYEFPESWCKAISQFEICMCLFLSKAFIDVSDWCKLTFALHMHILG